MEAIWNLGRLAAAILVFIYTIAMYNSCESQGGKMEVEYSWGWRTKFCVVREEK